MGEAMNVSDAGVTMLTALEGSRPDPYRDEAGHLTIGVGHLLTKSELSSGKLFLGTMAIDWRRGLSGGEIQDLLRQDLQEAADTVAAAISVPLTSDQFDALVSFCFNVGSLAFIGSTLVQLLNGGEYEAVPAQLRQWVKVHRGDPPELVVSEGLQQRREVEVACWEAGTA